MNQPTPFQVLFVCVGNVCRSVLAERLTRQAVAARLGQRAGSFLVGSAGTRATVGQQMHPFVRDILSARSAEVDGFTSRQLTPALVAEADLVLTATVAERDKVIALLPAALRRAFTLAEFARLAGGAGPVGDGGDDVGARARAAVAGAQGMRGRLPYVEPALLDIPDPRPSPEAFEECATRIEVALKVPLDVLCPDALPFGSARARE